MPRMFLNGTAPKTALKDASKNATAAIQAGHVETVVLAYGSTTRADLKKKRRTSKPAVC